MLPPAAPVVSLFSSPRRDAPPWAFALGYLLAWAAAGLGAYAAFRALHLHLLGREPARQDRRRRARPGRRDGDARDSRRRDEREGEGDGDGDGDEHDYVLTISSVSRAVG
ncbi:MAG: hypothetical protein ACRDOP_04585 [Gaiellaceae bacterium]